MTLNAPIDNNGVPLGLPQEHFHLFRKDIEFEVKIDNLGKKSLKGTVHVQKPTKDFWSFDIPLSTLCKQSVQFPIFGNTYLQGITPPNQGLLPGNCHFKLWFMNGGCDGFVKLLDKCLFEIRKCKNNMQMFTQSSAMYNDLRNGQFSYQAFVDPNDPSQVFIEQPKQK